MLTISNIAGGGSGYYIGKDEKLGNYYLEGASRTFWGGGAKDALGLGDGNIKSEEFDRYWGIKQGADAYVIKPFRPGELLGTVKQLLSSKVA